MSRIRAIKPEFFRSRKLSECSVRVRLAFIGLWTACDDEGRYRYEPELLKADLWPFEAEVSAQDVESDVWELAKRALVCVYESEGKRHLHVVNWHEHQKINRPTPSRLPECSRKTHGGFPEDSSPRARAQDLELGTEEKELGTKTVVEQARPIDDVTRVFQAWQDSTGKHRAKLDGNRRYAIQAALDRYDAEDVLAAVCGWVNDPWPERPQHNDIVQLLWMGTRRKPQNMLEKMAALWRDGPPPAMGRRTTQAASTAQQMARLRPGKEGDADGLGRLDRHRDLAQRQLSRPAD